MGAGQGDGAGAAGSRDRRPCPRGVFRVVSGPFLLPALGFFLPPTKRIRLRGRHPPLVPSLPPHEAARLSQRLSVRLVTCGSYCLSGGRLKTRTDGDRSAQSTAQGRRGWLHTPVGRAACGGRARPCVYHRLSLPLLSHRWMELLEEAVRNATGRPGAAPAPTHPPPAGAQEPAHRSLTPSRCSPPRPPVVPTPPPSVPVCSPPTWPSGSPCLRRGGGGIESGPGDAGQHPPCSPGGRPVAGAEAYHLPLSDHPSLPVVTREARAASELTPPGWRQQCGG